MESIDTHADKSVNRILIGNKCDMPERAVSRSEAEALAKEYGVSYFEASAKKGIGVEEAFRNIAEQVVERLARDSTNLAGARGGAGAGGAGKAPAAGGAGGAGAVDIKADAGKAAGGGGGCCK
jgi:50S ribosomal subunit-associated GTPase HflX